MGIFSSSSSPVVNEMGLSPGCGRSESPSQGLERMAGEAPSRAGGTPPGSASDEPLMEVQLSEHDPETVTQTDCGQGGPGCGREDEPEQSSDKPRRKRRHIVVDLSIERFMQLEELAKMAGIPRAHFVSSALLIGARKFQELI